MSGGSEGERRPQIGPSVEIVDVPLCIGVSHCWWPRHGHAYIDVSQIICLQAPAKAAGGGRAGAGGSGGWRL